MSTDNTDDPTSFRPAPPGQDSDSSLCVASEKTVSYSAVPRRPSCKDMYEPMANLEYDIDGDMIARLGFEPEGSATKPRFCEGNLSLLELLSDRHGYTLFREYLRVQKQESLLDFWQSCEEFKRLAHTGSNLATSKANATYNNYMHSKHLCAGILQDVIRVKVKHTLSCGQALNETLFDNAKDVILSYLNEIHYGRFLGSDVYKRSDVPKAMQSKDRVTTRNFTRYVGTALPPLHEEKVYEQSPATWTSYDLNTRSMGRALDDQRDGYVPQNLNLSKAALAGMFRQPVPPVVSVDHSDVQSLSSDALTDETKSTVTDLSELTAKAMEKKRAGAGFHDEAGFMPRTKKLPKARKQLPPEEFAKILIEKLERVLVEREQEERAAINLAGLPHEHVRENKKSILEDAAARHHQYQQARRLGLPLPANKFPEPYPIHSNTIPYLHTGYIEQQGITGYYPAMEAPESANTTWQGCQPERVLEKRQCAPLVSTKKQWESVGTIESAPDSGVSIEEDLSLPPEARNRILQWMEHSEKEVQQQVAKGNYTKSARTKQSCIYNTGLPGPVTVHDTMHLHPQDPLMPHLAQPDSRNTIEEVSRRLSQKNMQEKRTKSHKNRTGYLSSKASQGTCAKFSGESADCSSSVLSGDCHPAAIYSSSSVLSSVPSTVNSKDSGFGGIQKNKRPVGGTKIFYYLDGEKYPYQSVLPEKFVVLRQFKELVAFKKGNYRYFFKTETDEEDCGAVYVEIRDDEAILPCYGDKIICKVKESKHV